MAGPSLADLTAGTRQTIGRYFSVVSVAPSLLFVIYTFVLVRSGAWNHHPNWSGAVGALEHIGIGGGIVLIVLAVGLGIGVHPLQFGLVQFMEGYWGANAIARKARDIRIARHRQRFISLRNKDADGDQEAGRLLTLYPKESSLVMPTRLGNVLRRYEVLAGRQYELNLLTVLPHIALVAQPEDVRYLDDQRAQLDLAIRMHLMGLLAAALSIAVLVRDGPWLVISMIPAIIAYVSYRGSIITAREYGIAMTTLIDLNRFAFYERFHLPMPSNITEERATNQRLMQLLEANSTHSRIRYKHPSTP